ncbi:MAG: bifunctional tetrahydrofolate synthase/dihydrofolate synthase [Candidatus Methylumidiphilus sp.]
MRFATLAEWLAWQEQLHPKAIDMGLGRVSKVFQAMRPRPATPFTITVGGTNGKGSSVALLSAILRAEGYRVGAYTSPHLLRYNERIRIDGECLDDAALCAAFARVDHARGDTSLSFFEFGTLAALDVFAQAALDVQILEVGLGGRLDAVNIIDADAALIASIDIDHRDWLGHSREAIALEKAGILRPGRPAVIADPQPPHTLFDYAQAQGISLSCQGRDFGFRHHGETWDWWGAGDTLSGLPLPALAGGHQLLNAAAVIQLLRTVAAVRPVSAEAIRTGLRTVKLDGRFQYFPGSPPVLLDVAHNPQAAGNLAEYLRAEFAGKSIHAVFAVMRDKDVAGIVQPLREVVRHWYLAPIPLQRSAPESELSAVFAELSVAEVTGGFATAADAIAAARAAAPADGLVLVFGTFPLVSEFLALNPY